MSNAKPTAEDSLDPKPSKKNILTFLIWGIAIASGFAVHDYVSERAFNPLFFGINTVVYGFFSFLIKSKMRFTTAKDKSD